MDRGTDAPTDMARADDGVVEPPPKPHLLVVHLSHGVIGRTWYPTGGETDFVLGDALRPLERHRDRMLILRGIDVAFPDGEGELARWNTTHGATPVLLTGSLGSRVGGDYLAGGPSIDQLLRRSDVPFAPINMLISSFPESPMSVAWLGADEPIVGDSNPATLFERYFGEIVVADSAPIDALRRQVEGLEAVAEGEFDRPTLDAFLAIVGTSFRYDLTGTATLQLGSEGALRLPGVPGNLNRAMHELDREPSLAAAVTNYHAEVADALALLLDSLDAIRVGTGSLLDQTLVLVLSETGSQDDGGIHDGEDIPALLLGNIGGGLRTGRYLNVNASHADLLLTIAQLFDPELMTFGDPSLGASPIEVLRAE